MATARLLIALTLIKPGIVCHNIGYNLFCTVCICHDNLITCTRLPSLNFLSPQDKSLRHYRLSVAGLEDFLYFNIVKSKLERLFKEIQYASTTRSPLPMQLAEISDAAVIMNDYTISTLPPAVSTTRVNGTVITQSHPPTTAVATGSDIPMDIIFDESPGIPSFHTSMILLSVLIVVIIVVLITGICLYRQHRIARLTHRR